LNHGLILLLAFFGRLVAWLVFSLQRTVQALQL
jgi:hypothetical protein